MSKSKQPVIDSSKAMHWITIIGTLIFYLICYVVVIIAGVRYSTPPSSVSVSISNILEVIWDSLGNAGTLVPLGVNIVLSFVLYKVNKTIPKRYIVILAFLLFLQYCFYSVCVKYFINQVLVALVGYSTFFVCAILILLQLPKPIVKSKSIIKNALGNKIKNGKIAGIQIFECSMKEDFEKFIYSIHSIDQFSKNDIDINGMLSVTYELKKTDVRGFEFVTKTYYQSLVESASDEIKDQLISVIENKCNEIKQRLQQIQAPEAVTKSDCYLARLLVMYNAYLGILKPSSAGSIPDAYIGEQDFHDGDLGVDPSIEKRLFTLIRTGLLGGILVGTKSIYNFQYRKDGYKVGRQYCAFQLDAGTSADNSRIFICLIVLKEGSVQSMPPYLLSAIRKLIPLLENSLQKAVEEGI